MLPHTTRFATYRHRAPFRVPFHSGSMLHGLLGQALRRVACSRGPRCEGACAEPAACRYSALFSPPRPASREALLGAGQGAPPRLMPIVPPPGATELAAGEEFGFGVRLFGEAAERDLDDLEGAFEAIADLPWGREGGRVDLVTIGRLGPRRQELTVATGKWAAGTVDIHCETPLWIERRGRLVRDLDLRTLVASTARRVTVLSRLYGSWSSDEDEQMRELVAKAAAVPSQARLKPLRWERQRTDREEAQPLRGLLGELRAVGPVGELLPLLGAAEVVHVGKGTSFGLGRVRVTPSS